MEATFEEFKSIFENTETMPKNKEEFMMKLYQWYSIGRKNKTEQMLNNFIKLVEREIIK